MNTGALTIRNLHYAYDDGTVVLKGLDLTVNAGERLGIIGPNGAGKTTLFLNINGILKKDSGDIRVDEISLDEKGALRQIRRIVGIMFQNPDDQLFSSSVFDDVMFGPLNMGMDRQTAHAKAHEILNVIGLSRHENKPPQHLSLGEQRLAALATILVMEPRILLIDEPSSNLDPRAKCLLIRLLNEFRVTQIIAGHDFEFLLGACDRIVLLADGKIVASGDPLEILTDEPLLVKHGLALPIGIRVIRDCLEKTPEDLPDSLKTAPFLKKN